METSNTIWQTLTNTNNTYQIHHNSQRQQYTQLYKIQHTSATTTTILTKITTVPINITTNTLLTNTKVRSKRHEGPKRSREKDTEKVNIRNLFAKGRSIQQQMTSVRMEKELLKYVNVRLSLTDCIRT